MNYREQENLCQQSFDSRNQYWHLCTPGKETGLIFKNEEDYVFAMNVFAHAAMLFPKLELITFVIMDNHIHILVVGEEKDVILFFNFLRKRLNRGLEGGLPKEFVPALYRITDLDMMRNVIVYINRNGYVSNPNYTPFNYPWGANADYFNRPAQGKPISELGYVNIRKAFRVSSLNLPENWLTNDGYVSPVSYCAIELGMSMFRSAHHYYSLLNKNVEAYQGVAAAVDDGEYLTDIEVFDKVWAIVKNQYKLDSMRNLSYAQKKDLANMLHYDFRSSNGQIRRVLYLSQSEVNSLFPLSSK